jgi:hypothetical protein
VGVVFALLLCLFPQAVNSWSTETLPVYKGLETDGKPTKPLCAFKISSRIMSSRLKASRRLSNWIILNAIITLTISVPVDLTDQPPTCIMPDTQEPQAAVAQQSGHWSPDDRRNLAYNFARIYGSYCAIVHKNILPIKENTGNNSRSTAVD